MIGATGCLRGALATTLPGNVRRSRVAVSKP
jgi:hypothetical protein